jgi:glutathione S-transferase
MTKGKLYAQAQNFRTQKVLTAAKFANKDVDVVTSAPPADKFPFGVAPAFEDGQTLLFGDETIAHYLLGDKLKAKNVEVGQWVEWGSGSLQRNVLAYVLPSVSAVEVDQATLNNAKTELFAQLEVFNKFLLSRTFLDGERLSWADVSVAFSLLPAFQHVLGEAERKKFVNVTRWFNTVVHQENVKAIVGALELPAKASTFDAAKFKQLSAKTQQQSKKQEQPKKVEPASFDQTRQIRLTDGEAMYVVPGTAGVCVVLRQAAGCGNPGVSNRLLGLYVEDKQTGNMIGAGIADKTVRRVVASLQGASAVIPVRHGIFLLPAEAGLRQPRVGDLVPPVVRAEPTKHTP